MIFIFDDFYLFDQNLLQQKGLTPALIIINISIINNIIITSSISSRLVFLLVALCYITTLLKCQKSICVWPKSNISFFLSQNDLARKNAFIYLHPVIDYELI